MIISCHGKRQYDNFKLANSCAKDVGRRHKESMRAYKCSYCGKFHVGAVTKNAGNNRKIMILNKQSKFLRKTDDNKCKNIER